MSVPNSRKRGPAPADGKEVTRRLSKMKKKGQREFVTPDLLDETSKFKFFFGRKALSHTQGCLILFKNSRRKV